MKNTLPWALFGLVLMTSGTVFAQRNIALDDQSVVYDQRGVQTSYEWMAPAEGQAACCENGCDVGCDQGCRGHRFGRMFERSCNAGCQDCPNRGLQVFAGFDSFRGVADTNWQDNFGVVSGLNFGTPVIGLSDFGIGWQIGGSYGLYDLTGRGTGARDTSTQQQVFLTTGLFRKADADERLSFGLVYDWMVNDAYGEDAENATFGQWRGQVEFEMNDCTGIGLAGTYRDRNDVVLGSVYRSVNQANVFIHRKFQQGADGRLWIGVPTEDRLGFNERPGDWILGGSIEVPLSQTLALYANFDYMKPPHNAGALASEEVTYDIGFGLVWYPGRNACTKALNGSCWTPYMPVANNGSFMTTW